MANSKRSRHVALMLMAPAGSFFISGCSEAPENALVFETIEQCQSFGGDEDECRIAHDEAVQNHNETAPKYLTEQECEADFGDEKCEARSNGWVTPLMAGFLMGSLIDIDGKKKKKTLMGRPLYKSRDDQTTFRSSGNKPIARNVGQTQVFKSSLASRSNNIVSRGGFGMQAQKRAESSSGGGGSYGG